MYPVTQKFITQNRSNKPLKPCGITLHETATPAATAERFYEVFNSAYKGASAHAFVDWDSIVQTIPWTEKAWHACEPANSLFIGIELCHPKTHNDEQFAEVWKRGVWLFADLFVNFLKITKITKDNLMSHHEVALRWHNTTHVDPTSYFKEYGKTVDDFRAAVQDEINNMINPAPQPPYKMTLPLIVQSETATCFSQPDVMSPVVKCFKKFDKLTAINESPDELWYQLTIGWIQKINFEVEKPKTKYTQIEVLVDVLNCRTAPNMSANVIRTYKKGDKLTAVGISQNNFWQILLNGKPAYVSSNPKHTKVFNEFYK